MKRIIFIAIVIIIAFFAIGLLPVTKNNTASTSGTVRLIREGGVKDLVFELEGDNTSYYINRGLENGFDLATAKKRFEGQRIRLTYANSWTPLAPFGTTSKHLFFAAVNDTVIFSE